MCETARTRENQSDTRDNTEYSPTLNGPLNPQTQRALYNSRIGFSEIKYLQVPSPQEKSRSTQELKVY